jgi:hypothetical protein
MERREPQDSQRSIVQYSRKIRNLHISTFLWAQHFDQFSFKLASGRRPGAAIMIASASGWGPAGTLTRIIAFDRRRGVPYWTDQIHAWLHAFKLHLNPSSNDTGTGNRPPQLSTEPRRRASEDRDALASADMAGQRFHLGVFTSITRFSCLPSWIPSLSTTWQWTWTVWTASAKTPGCYYM